jgi:hypothetical protein
VNIPEVTPNFVDIFYYFDDKHYLCAKGSYAPDISPPETASDTVEWFDNVSKFSNDYEV